MITAILSNRSNIANIHPFNNEPVSDPNDAQDHNQDTAGYRRGEGIYYIIAAEDLDIGCEGNPIDLDLETDPIDNLGIDEEWENVRIDERWLDDQKGDR